MRHWFRHAASTQSAPVAQPAQTPDTVLASVRDQIARIDALEEALAALERSETTRTAEHAAQLDQLNRLLKRFAQRIVREGQDTPSDNGESVMQLRKRLGR